MIDLLLPMLIAAAIGSLGWWYVATGREMVVRERLLYGLEDPPPPVEEDLTDPAYGLRGLSRFGYFATLFLTSWKGRLTIVALGSALGFGIGYWQGLELRANASVALATGILLMLLVFYVLFRRDLRHQRRIRNELPYALEMLSALMKGGLAFEAALRHLVNESDTGHPLYRELATMNEAMRRGRRRIEAFRLMADRCQHFEVSEVMSALTQADQTGASLADVMRHHAHGIFRETEADIRQRAERLPIRLMFPMLFTIFPALFVVLLMPNLLRILRMISAVMGDVAAGVGSVTPP